MKSSERHKLKENKAAIYAGAFIEWVGKNAGKIFVVGSILVIIVATVLFLNYTAKKKNNKAAVTITRTIKDLGDGSLNKVSKDKFPIILDLVDKYKNLEAGASLAFKVGNYYVEKKDYKMAEKYYNIALDELDNKGNVLLALANIKIDEKAYNKALNYLKKIDEEYPLYDNVLYLKYLCAEKNNDKEMQKDILSKFKDDKYKNSKYFNLIKIREVL